MVGMGMELHIVYMTHSIRSVCQTTAYNYQCHKKSATYYVVIKSLHHPEVHNNLQGQSVHLPGSHLFHVSCSI